ncbi:plasmid mobilization protein [Listeria goaensis]|uniref:plasmid mobilization protein n=1 Tax=Listeria goaensis TaxID=1649188 RepID=UPI001F07E8BD|nr:hypothetical protein [Listeria goaensis]
MAERHRNKQLNFRVTEEEKKFIRFKMEEAGIQNRETYLRKMAIEGMIIKMGFTVIKKTKCRIK